MKTWIFRTLAGLGIAAVAAQAIPYGRDHDNPSVVSEPAWSSPEVRALAVRACFDCHSNQTTWPWYSHVAPASWLVQSDVIEGRSKLNFSDWNRPQKGAHKAAKEVTSGDMPPAAYVPLHPAARLSAAERDRLAQGLSVMLSRK
ncbi:MAG: heme-binding domain-containing protein [Polyangiaceae bacterium]